MEIAITKDFFESTIYTATNANADVFNSLDYEFRKAADYAKYLFVPKGMENFTFPTTLVDEVQRYVCFRAFYLAIPMLDLVLTGSGFGVVSNQNIAPASRDRVDALRTNMRNHMDDARDNVTNMLIALGNNDWSQSFTARTLITSLIFTGEEMRLYCGKPDAHLSDLQENVVKLREADEMLCTYFSEELYAHLLEKLRIDSFSDKEINLVSYMRQAIGYKFQDNRMALKQMLRNISQYLEDNIDDFPTYKASKAYEVKHFEFYQNAQDDTTFFFG